MTFRRLVARYPLASMAASMVLASGLTILLLWPGSPGISGILEFESLSLTAATGPKRSSSVQAQTLILSRHESAVVLGLNPPPRLDLSFDLPTIAAAVLIQGEVSSEPIPTRLQEEGIYVLWVPVDELSSGPLRIELRDPTRREIFAEYSLDVLVNESP